MEPIEVIVIAGERYNDLGLDVEPGDRYVFTVLACEDWRDASIPATPDGIEGNWLMRLLSPFKRMRDEGYLALVGAVGMDDSNLFLIGSHSEHTFKTAGRLHAFANDVPGFYGNNHGTVRLQITQP